MKKVFALILALAMSMSLFACGQSGSKDDGQKKFKVAINCWGQANFFGRAGKEAMEDELTKLGCEIIPTVTDNTPDRMKAIENATALGVDAIIVQEGDITEAETAVLEAKQKGIIIGSMDSGTADYVDFYVTSDNTLLGKTTAEALVEKMGAKGKIIEIIDDSGSMTRKRKAAAHEVFDQYPDIEIAYSLVYSWPDYDADMMNQVSAVLTKEGDNISGVFAVFDGVGVSAYKAIKEFGLQDKILICGVDGDPDVYALMKADGENCNYVCTMAQDPDTMARTCVRAVVDLLNGKTLDSKVEYIPGIKVTPANVNEIG